MLPTSCHRILIIGGSSVGSFPLPYSAARSNSTVFVIAPFKEAYPNAKLIGSGALAEKKPELKFDGCETIRLPAFFTAKTDDFQCT